MGLIFSNEVSKHVGGVKVRMYVSSHKLAPSESHRRPVVMANGHNV